MVRPTLVITSGEPSGIGPDICLQILGNIDIRLRWLQKAHIVILGDSAVFAERASALNIAFHPEKMPEGFSFTPINSGGKVVAGRPNPLHAHYVLAMIEQATTGCLASPATRQDTAAMPKYSAMITAPIQKSTIINAGFPHFQGHTEYLAELCNREYSMASPTTPPFIPVMMLTESSQKPHPLRVCLATTHIPLSQVTHKVDEITLVNTTRIMAHELHYRYAIPRPRIALLGLNPHAGEDGKIGVEEINTIAPAIVTMRAKQNIEALADVEGPLSADTAFIPHTRAKFHAYLGMYHDQVLPVFKALSFGGGINVTLGLPIVRTSVDHGTALGLAGTGQANSSGLVAAIDEAVFLAYGGSRHNSPLSRHD